MGTISNSEQIFTGQISKYANLISGIVALIGSLVVLILFMDFGTDSVGSHKIYITIKPGYSSWAWGVFSLSSMLYYYARSNGSTTSGGYINPLFSSLIEIMHVFPFIGLVLSWIGGTEFIIASQTRNTIITATSVFFDSILILFVAANFGAGISGIKRFFANKTSYS